MYRAETLTLVCTPTRPLLELFAPAPANNLQDDFATLSLGAGPLGAPGTISAPTQPGLSLDTPLALGRCFQAVRTASRLPTGSQEPVSFIRPWPKDSQLTQLTGPRFPSSPGAIVSERPRAAGFAGWTSKPAFRWPKRPPGVRRSRKVSWPIMGKRPSEPVLPWRRPFRPIPLAPPEVPPTSSGLPQPGPPHHLG